jgi:hypothetical protein
VLLGVQPSELERMPLQLRADVIWLHGAEEYLKAKIYVQRR